MMSCYKRLAIILLMGWFIQLNTIQAQQLNRPQPVGFDPSTSAVQPAQNQPAAYPQTTTNKSSSPSSATSVSLAPMTQPAAKTLYIFDTEKYLLKQPENKSWQYDVINLVTTLQGLVNRQQPQLYQLYVRERLSTNNMNVDQYWLQILRGSDGYLSDYTLVHIATIEELLDIFRDYYSAVVLWDQELPATGNLALTICGADGWLPVRYDPSPDSLYTQVVAGGPELPPQLNLSGRFTGVGFIPNTNETQKSTETAKTDAYLWLKQMYLESGLCAPNYLAFYLDPHDWDPKAPGYQYPDLDNCSIVNHDYYIGKKAFFLDMDPFFDEFATDIFVDNPFNKGKDRSILDSILLSAYQNTPGDDRLLRIGGFIPWWIKYSSEYLHPGGRTSLHTRSEASELFISLMSRYNGIIDADRTPFASIANSSVFQHIPLKNRYFQNPVPHTGILEPNTNYILFSIGDFNSSAQLYQTIPSLWQDSMRGELPITWSIAPILSERVPHIFDFLYKTRTDNDYFVSGTPGAGLCYINNFIPQNRPEGLENGLYFWEKISKMLYRKFDLRTTLAGDLSTDVRTVTFSEDLQRAFKSFSPHGVGVLKRYQTPLIDNILPFTLENANYLSKMPDFEIVIQRILSVSKKDEPSFQIYRFNNANPTTLFLLYKELVQNYSDEYRFKIVDPFTFFYLLRQSYSGNDPSSNFLIPEFLSHTIPMEMEQGKTYQTTVTLRNDGWDIWNPANINPNQRYRLTYKWFEESQEISTIGTHDAYVNGPVLPNDQTTLVLNIQSPEKSGLYRLVLIYGQENVRESYLDKELLIFIN